MFRGDGFDLVEEASMRVSGAEKRYSRGVSRARLRVRRLAVLLAGCAGVGLFLVVAVAISGGRVLGVAASAGEPMVTGTGTVSFSAVVNPNGRRTVAYFEFGLDGHYREPRTSTVVYDERTPLVHLGSGSGDHQVSGSVSGLVPNAVYHLRLVASSPAGTVRSRDRTFRTAKDRPPPPPVIGKTANVKPVSGLVLIQSPKAKSSRVAVRALQVEGRGFLPLTESLALPIGSQIDARDGTLQLVVASAQRRHTQRVTLAGGLFSVAQASNGIAKGLTMLNLLEDDFPGAPSAKSCSATTAANDPGPPASGAQPVSRVLQTLHARDQGGKFQTLGRYSTATVNGTTTWDTTDRCDGTLTIVHRGTVSLFDLGLSETIAVVAGQRYLAKAP
jgi:hypothetical protein